VILGLALLGGGCTGGQPPEPVAQAAAQSGYPTMAAAHVQAVTEARPAPVAPAAAPVTHDPAFTG